MSKREQEDLHLPEKKLKPMKKDDIAIDSELLGQQSSYNKRVGDQDVADAEAAAAAAVAAVTNDAHNVAQSHNLHMQHLAYQNAFRQQQQQQQQQQHHQQQAQQHAQQQAQQHVVHLQSGGPQDPSSPSSTGSNNGVNAEYSPQMSNSKVHHGTDEWHRQRRDNHKEVERRRRESINIGIKELAALIPTQDTNKAQILQRTVEYIKRLKENENNNIEKWTLEKLLTEQAVSELSASNEKLKVELERAYREIEQWKELAGANKK